MLGIVAIWMVKEGIDHLINKPPVSYKEALPVAAVGSVREPGVGAAARIAASLRSHGHDHRSRITTTTITIITITTHPPKAGTLDFNLRAAYIHIMADAFTSVLAIAALALGWWAGVWFLDPMMGLVGGAVIMWWTVSLCRQASRQLLDVVSSPEHEAVVRKKLEAIDDVRVADLHVWELGPGRRSCIVSLVTATPRELDILPGRGADGASGRAPDDRDPPLRAASTIIMGPRLRTPTSTDDDRLHVADM